MSKVFIIAEAGVNHNGKIKTAKKMIDAAVEAGADAVKFQTFKSEKIISKSAQKADYQKISTRKNETQLEMIKKLELNVDAHKELLQYSSEKNIKFISSPFDLDSIDLLDSLGLDIIKIPSGEIVNLPFLSKIGRLKKKVILSTGMSNLSEIETALDILVKSGTDKKNITVLHCNTEYPTPMEDVNLLAMVTIRDAFKIKTGYSDHTLGIEVPIAAVSLGASVIEKHFTLNKNMAGPDHKSSLEPYELNSMVKAIRNIEKALGTGEKKPSKSEQKNIDVVRKVIVADKHIKKGEILCEGNLTLKRSGKGISAKYWYMILGTKASKNFDKDENITL